MSIVHQRLTDAPAYLPPLLKLAWGLKWLSVSGQLTFERLIQYQPLLSHALLRALWAEERNTADAKVRIAIAEANGMPGAELQAEEQSARVQRLYAQYSEEAEKLGVFGAPTYVLNGERFWGQDRLDFLDRALANSVLST